MKNLKFKIKEPVDLQPTGLERNFPLIGIAKYILRTRSNPYKDSFERNMQIKEIGYRQAKISAGLTFAGTVIAGLLGYHN